LSDIPELLESIKSGTADWPDYAEFLRLEPEDAVPFFDLAGLLTRQCLPPVLKVFIPGDRFPAVSITGTDCALACEHCNKKYLKGMKAAANAADLEALLLKHADSGGTGALISGGHTVNGAVPLSGFLDSIKNIKRRTNLFINVHTGLLDEQTAQKLADAGVDAVSFDVNMDEEAVRDIYHLHKGLTEYRKAVGFLKKYGLHIVPHVCIGLYYGRLHKELESVRFIRESGIDPSLIVFIALVPPEGRPPGGKQFTAPLPLEIAKVIALTRFIFPDREISLGCLRPKEKDRFDIEKNAIRAGANRIVLPSKEILDWVRNEYPKTVIKEYTACCVVT
jgi:uncharacterized radical SAM superfamily protein